MDNILLDLWNDKIHPRENLGPKTPEYKDLCEQMSETKKLLDNVLSDEDRKLLTNFEETSDLISEALHAEAFCVGFRLAARLLADSFNDESDLAAVKRFLGITP